VITDWRLRRWRLWFLALMTAARPRPHEKQNKNPDALGATATSAGAASDRKDLQTGFLRGIRVFAKTATILSQKWFAAMTCPQECRQTEGGRVS